MPTILLAIDACTQLERLLPAALLLASQQHATLLGMFVRDSGLLQGAALPFTQEVGANSATCYPLTADSIGKRLLSIAETMRRQLAVAAKRQQLPFEFQICSGSISQITADSEADVVLPGWSTDSSVTTMRARLSTTRAARKSVIVVVNDGSPSSSCVIEAARRLMKRDRTHQLVIFETFLPAPLLHNSPSTISRSESRETIIPVASTENLIRQIYLLCPTVMLIGRGQNLATDNPLQKKLASIMCPLALVQSAW